MTSLRYPNSMDESEDKFGYKILENLSYDDEEDSVIEETNYCAFCWTSWCWIFRVLLLFVGVGIPIYFYLQPCWGTYENHHVPVDIVFMLDGSGSMSVWNWHESIKATKIWMDTFMDEFKQDLRFGVMEFSTSSSQQLTLTPSTNRSDIDDHLNGMMKNDGLTYYSRALKAMDKDIRIHRANETFDSWVLGVIITDGEPTDDPEKLVEISSQLKQNYTLMVILVGERYSGSKAFPVTSCEDYIFPTKDCIWWEKLESYDDLVVNASRIAGNVVTEANLVDEECSGAYWWFFLLLLLPIFCSFCCCCFTVVVKRELDRPQLVLYDFHEKQSDDPLIEEIALAYPAMIRNFQEEPTLAQCKQIQNKTADFVRRLKSKRRGMESERDELAGKVRRMKAEMKRAEDLLQRKKKEQDELLRRISKNIYETLNSKSTKAMLTRMPNPPDVLRRLGQATVLLLSGKTSLPVWKDVQRYLTRSGFSGLQDDHQISETTYELVRDLLKDINEARAISAAGNLGLSLSKFVDQMFLYSDQGREMQSIEDQLAEARRKHRETYGEIDFQLQSIDEEIEAIRDTEVKMKKNNGRLKRFISEMKDHGWERFEVVVERVVEERGKKPQLQRTKTMTRVQTKWNLDIDDGNVSLLEGGDDTSSQVHTDPSSMHI